MLLLSQDVDHWFFQPRWFEAASIGVTGCCPEGGAVPCIAILSSCGQGRPKLPPAPAFGLKKVILQQLKEIASSPLQSFCVVTIHLERRSFFLAGATWIRI